jgi:hypothetical protein
MLFRLCLSAAVHGSTARYGNIDRDVGTNLHMSIFAFLDDRLRPKMPFPSISTDQHLDKQTAGLTGTVAKLTTIRYVYLMPLWHFSSLPMPAERL